VDEIKANGGEAIYVAADAAYYAQIENVAVRGGTIWRALILGSHRRRRAVCQIHRHDA
jgi:hypothetical protein